MADYYSILKKTIEGLPSNTPQIREAVYARARAAIEKQLRNLEPTPGDDVVATQMELLETAILSIDDEYGGDATSSMSAALATEASSVAEEPAEVSQPSSAPTQESVAANDEGMAPPPSVPEPPSVGVVPPPPADSVPPEMPAPDSTQSTAGDPVQTDIEPSTVAPVGPADMDTATGPDTAEAVAAEAPAVPETASTPETQTVQEPIPPALPAAEPPAPVAEPSPPTTTVAPAPAMSGQPQNVAPTVEQNEAADAILDKYAKKPKPSLIKRLIVPLVILVLLAAAGFGAWSMRDTITPMVSSLLGGGETTTTDDQSGASDANTVSDKEAVKLGENGEDEEAQPIVEEEATQPEAEQSEGTSEEPKDEATETSEVAPAEEQPAAEQVTEQAQSEEPATSAPVALPPGETAFLYQEADGGTGATRTDASVAWSTTMASPLTGFPEEPVIKAVMSVPEKGMTMELHLSRNVDETLSASHVIDLQFELPAESEQGTVDNVLRFVLKNTEEARGEPLVAVPVKVRDNHFLIALDNLEQAVQVNEQLLLNSNWIDINISYASGKRALVTLAKGADGGTTFQNAFNDWRNR